MASSADLPAVLAERPTDPSYGVPVPFACERDDGPYSLGAMNRKRVIQCALSRICGMCGLPLHNPVVFLGTADDADRNDFRVPPLHLECARAALALYPPLATPVLGYPRRSCLIIRIPRSIRPSARRPSGPATDPRPSGDPPPGAAAGRR